VKQKRGADKFIKTIHFLKTFKLIVIFELLIIADYNNWFIETERQGIE